MGRHTVLIAVLLLCQHDIRGEDFTLAVSNLVAQGVQENEAMVVSEQLRSELMKGGRVRLIERSQMDEILKEQGFQKSGCVTDACAVEVGQLLSVNHIIVGSVGSAGNYTVLTVRLLDVSTGVVVFDKAVRTRGGVDAVLEESIPAAVLALEQSLLPGQSQSESALSAEKRHSVRRNLIIAGVSVAVVGGGVAALLLMNDSAGSDDSEPGQTNTRIELP